MRNLTIAIGPRRSIKITPTSLGAQTHDFKLDLAQGAEVEPRQLTVTRSRLIDKV